MLFEPEQANGDVVYGVERWVVSYSTLTMVDSDQVCRD